MSFSADFSINRWARNNQKFKMRRDKKHRESLTRGIPSITKRAFSNMRNSLREESWIPLFKFLQIKEYRFFPHSSMAKYLAEKLKGDTFSFLWMIFLSCLKGRDWKPYFHLRVFAFSSLSKCERETLKSLIFLAQGNLQHQQSIVKLMGDTFFFFCMIFLTCLRLRDWNPIFIYESLHFHHFQLWKREIKISNFF